MSNIDDLDDPTQDVVIGPGDELKPKIVLQTQLLMLDQMIADSIYPLERLLNIQIKEQCLKQIEEKRARRRRRQEARR